MLKQRPYALAALEDHPASATHLTNDDSAAAAAADDDKNNAAPCVARIGIETCIKSVHRDTSIYPYAPPEL